MLPIAAILVLAASPAEIAAEAPRRVALQVIIQAQAEILRAGTSETEEQAGAPRRQVRLRPDGRSTVEFE